MDTNEFGTPVQMADGSAKPIETVQPGDSVQSRDEHTGKTQAKTVEHVTVRQAGETVQLVFAPPGNTGSNSSKEAGDKAAAETIVTTREHPFYVDGQGFVPAGKLHEGNSIVTRAGPALVVQSVTFLPPTQGTRVYNLTVADTHTYFVGTTHGGVWVHNDCRFPWNSGQADHIFRDARGHVNIPNTDQATRSLYAELFERVGSNAANVRTDAVAARLLPGGAARAGVQAYTQVLPNGRQVWVFVRNNIITDAGINLPGFHR